MTKKNRTKKACLLVRNNCVFDSRVIRAAETMASAGLEVTVICVHGKTLPLCEVKNGVTYRRLRTKRLRDQAMTYDWIRILYLILQKVKPQKTQTQKYLLENKNSKLLSFMYKIVSFSVVATAFFVVWTVNLLPLSIREILISFIFRFFKRPALIVKKIGVKIIKLSFRKFQQASAAALYDRLAIHQLKNIKPDIIQANELNTLQAATDFKRLHQPKTRIIYDSHELEADRDSVLDENHRAVILGKERKFLKYVDKTLTVSHGIADILQKYHGITPTVIYSSPVILNKKNELRHKPGLRLATGLADDVPLAVYVGRLKIGRGHELIIEALTSAPNVHLALMGVQPQNVLSHLQDIIARLGLARRVHFVSPCDHDIVPYFIQDADFGVIPTQNKGLSYQFAMPNKLFEMTLAGLPVIAGQLPEISEYILKNNIGITMDQTDPKDIARAMKEMIERNHEMKPDADNLKMLIEEYSGQAQAKKMAAIYFELLAEKNTNLDD